MRRSAIERLEHWLARLTEGDESVAASQARLALAEVKDEREQGQRRNVELFEQVGFHREVVSLCEHGDVCEIGLWRAGNERWFAQITLCDGTELDAHSGGTLVEAVANARELMAERDASKDGG